MIFLTQESDQEALFQADRTLLDHITHLFLCKFDMRQNYTFLLLLLDVQWAIQPALGILLELEAVTEVQIELHLTRLIGLLDFPLVLYHREKCLS